MSLDIYIAIIIFFSNRIFSIDHMQEHVLYNYIVFTIEILVPQLKVYMCSHFIRSIVTYETYAECETFSHACMHMSFVVAI